MWTAARGAWSTHRNTVLACALAFVLGVLSVDQHDPPEPEPAPVATITERSVRRLAAAIEAATRPTVTAPPDLVDQADAVLDQVREGTVAVTRAPPTTTPTTWPPPTTTTTTPPTTTTTTVPADGTLRWPTTSTVPPPYTVTVP